MTKVMVGKCGGNGPAWEVCGWILMPILGIYFDFWGGGEGFRLEKPGEKRDETQRERESG